ncbi:MAG: HAD hydrolase-like protein [Candidatus Sericytochromatia bacterium]
MSSSFDFILNIINKISKKLNITNIYSFNEDDLIIDLPLKKIALSKVIEETKNEEVFIGFLKNIPIYTIIKNLNIEKDLFLINLSNIELSFGIKNTLKRNDINILNINPDISIIYKTKNQVLIDFITKITYFSNFINTTKTETDYHNYINLNSEKIDLFRSDIRIANLYNDINSGKYKVLSIDFFDTLVFRLCSMPNGLFLTLYKKLLKEGLIEDIYNKEEFMVIRQVAEVSARQELIKNGVVEITIEQIYAKLINLISDIPKAIDIEKNLEIEFCFVNPFLESLIKYAKAKGITIIITSDMYLAQTDLKNILANNNFDVSLIDYFFVSSEYNASKYDKTLYYKIFNYFNIKSNELIHIGDNIGSDYNNAVELGIKSYLYIDHQYLLNSRQGEGYLINHKLNDYSNIAFRKIFSNMFISEDVKENILFKLGTTTLAPILTSYIYWVLFEAKRKNIKNILVVMRDGDIFAEMLKKVSLSLDYDLNIAYFYSSRLSSILPALYEDLSIDNLIISTRFLLNTENKFAETKTILSKLSLTFSDSFFYEHKLPKIVELDNENLGNFFKKILSTDLKEQLEYLIKERTSNFLEYTLSLITENNSNENIGIIDLGYGGSVQSFLQRIFKHKKINYTLYGLYLFTNKGILDKPLKEKSFYKSYLSSVFFSSSLINSYSTHLGVFETILSSLVGTAVNYNDNFLGVNQELAEVKESSTYKVINKIKEGILLYNDFYTKIVSSKKDLFLNYFFDKNYILQENSAILARFHAMPFEEELAVLNTLDCKIWLEESLKNKK